MIYFVFFFFKVKDKLRNAVFLEPLFLNLVVKRRLTSTLPFTTYLLTGVLDLERAGEPDLMSQEIEIKSMKPICGI